MTKKSDAPAIRFKGFSDAWEQRKLSELTSLALLIFLGNSVSYLNSLLCTPELDGKTSEPRSF